MKTSAGILLYRISREAAEVFLVHPGGPFWKNKDIGAWSIPKGEFGLGEESLETAKREFQEETGQVIEGYFIPLEPITQKGGKTVYAWAVEGDIDAATIVSNYITIAWPPGTGKVMEIPEVDRGEWFDLETALTKINPAQANFIKQLAMLMDKA